MQSAICLQGNRARIAHGCDAEHENGEVEVSAVNPLENLDKTFNTTALADLATEVGIRLRAAVDYIHREPPKLVAHALPPGIALVK
jgi:hypothetical protein